MYTLCVGGHPIPYLVIPGPGPPGAPDVPYLSRPLGGDRGKER